MPNVTCLYHGERVLEELNDSGTLSRSPMGACPERSRGDNIGTARGLVDASGAVTDTYELDTFGRQVSSTGATPNPYRFGGAWGYITDPSGLLQLGARYYWPELGKFVSQDPIRYAINRYDYIGSNPVLRADPTGYVWWNPSTWFPPKPKPPKPCPPPQPCPEPSHPCKDQLKKDLAACDRQYTSLAATSVAVFGLQSMNNCMDNEGNDQPSSVWDDVSTGTALYSNLDSASELYRECTTEAWRRYNLCEIWPNPF